MFNLNELQTAHSRADPGFFGDYSSHPKAQPAAASGKAAQYFADQQHVWNQDDIDNVLIHDRERPQPNPHHYIPGRPGPLHYGVPMSDGYDAGVYAVAGALFGGSGAFRTIPIQFKPIFRRRRPGDSLPEWGNAFVTRVDPCECRSPEETFTPLEVARYRDQQGRVRTALEFTQ
ncbi:hypothetical protein Emed_004177 [Eimeria media]